MNTLNKSPFMCLLLWSTYPAHVALPHITYSPSSSWYQFAIGHKKKETFQKYFKTTCYRVVGTSNF